MNHPVYKLFIYKNLYFFYEPYSNRLLEISEDHYSELSLLQKLGFEKYNSLKHKNNTHKDILTLVNKGLITNFSIKEVVHPWTEYVNSIVNRCINSLTLQVTRDCNFKCRYCLFSDHNKIGRDHENKTMPLDIAKKSIDFLFDHSLDADAITIAFYGGEPLLNFDLIKYVTEYAEEIFISKKITFRMTINGSILDEKIIDYIVQHNFIIAISLDGPEHIQNKHRKYRINGGNTFDTVYKNIQLIANKHPEFYRNNLFFIPVLFSDENYENIKKFFNITLNISDDKIVPLDADLSGIDYTTSDVLTSVSNDEQINIFKRKAFDDMYHLVSLKNKISTQWHHSGQCIPAFKDLFVDIHGIFYPCEKAIENGGLSIGSINEGLDLYKIISFMNIGQLTCGECKSCWALRFCEICIMHCYDIEYDRIDRKQKLLSCDKQRIKALNFMKDYIDHMYLERTI